MKITTSVFQFHGVDASVQTVLQKKLRRNAVFRYIGSMSADQDHDPSQMPKIRSKTKKAGAPSFDVRAALFGVLGVDLTQIHGMGSSLSLKLVGECGTDLRAWPSAKHFTPWLCLVPGNKISGGKVLSSRTRRDL